MLQNIVPTPPLTVVPAISPRYIGTTVNANPLQIPTMKRAAYNEEGVVPNIVNSQEAKSRKDKITRIRFLPK